MAEWHGERRLSARVLRIPGDATQGAGTAGRNDPCEGSAPAPTTGETAVLEIEDSGPGIEFEVQARIFEPFFTTKRDGTGLGLATVQRIVEQHGGAIEVSSQPGEGTLFRMCLRCVGSIP